MAYYRKKPVVIQAAKFDGVLVGEYDSVSGKVVPRTCPEWFPAVTREVDRAPEPLSPGEVVSHGDHLYIGTLEGVHRAAPGDWIIRGVKGELYPCKPDIFAQTYDRV